METWRFKRGKSNRRLQLWTPECRRKAATLKAGARTASDCLLTFVRCCCAEFSATPTTDSGGGIKGAWTNVWPQDQPQSMYIFRVWNLDSSIKKLCPCKQAENGKSENDILQLGQSNQMIESLNSDKKS